MNGVKANAGPRMENTRLREPSIFQLAHSLPVQVMFLAAATQDLSPEPSHSNTECTEDFEVTWYRVVVEVALDDRLEPFAGECNGGVHAFA